MNKYISLLAFLIAGTTLSAAEPSLDKSLEVTVHLSHLQERQLIILSIIENIKPLFTPYDHVRSLTYERKEIDSRDGIRFIFTLENESEKEATCRFVPVLEPHLESHVVPALKHHEIECIARLLSSAIERCYVKYSLPVIDILNAMLDWTKEVRHAGNFCRATRMNVHRILQKALLVKEAEFAQEAKLAEEAMSTFKDMMQEVD